MTSLPLWQKLKQLVAFDAQHTAALEQIQELEVKIRELQVLPQILDENIKELKQACFDAKKNIALQELHAKDLKSREDKKRKMLDAIKNQTEYAGLLKEINQIVAQIAEHDDVLMKAWHTAELAEKKESTDIVKLQERIAEISTEIAQKEEALRSIKEKIAQIMEEKKTYMQTIPVEWLEKYESMHNRVPNPIAAVVRDCCSACFYAIPPQDLTRLKRAAILPCRSCYRLLYFDMTESTDAKKETF